jgi:hypothetical protein
VAGLKGREHVPTIGCTWLLLPRGRDQVHGWLTRRQKVGHEYVVEVNLARASGAVSGTLQ